MPPTSWVGARFVVHESADVVGADDTAYLDHVGVFVYGHLSEDGSEGLGGHGVLVLGGASAEPIASMVLLLRVRRAAMGSEVDGEDLA